MPQVPACATVVCVPRFARTIPPGTEPSRPKKLLAASAKPRLCSASASLRAALLVEGLVVLAAPGAAKVSVLPVAGSFGIGGVGGPLRSRPKPFKQVLVGEGLSQALPSG